MNFKLLQNKGYGIGKQTLKH